MRNLKTILYVPIVNKLSLAGNFLKQATSGFFIDTKSKLFINYNKSRWKDLSGRNKKSIILVEFYSVDQTVLAFSYFSNILAKKKNSEIISFSISSKSYFLLSIFYRRIFKIYKSFGVKKHVNTNFDFHLSNSQLLIFNDILFNIKTKSDILNISIDNICIGNEIYEAYLREKLKPTIDINSEDFKLFLLTCLKIFFFWQDYFRENNVKAVILSHGLYKYGIIRLIAVNKNIPVYLPTVRSMFCLTKPSEAGIPPFNLYPQIFNTFDLKQKKSALKWGRNRMMLRFSGEVGVDMNYSTKSAFHSNLTKSSHLSNSGQIKVLIASHCFFDNPNAYGPNLFVDFFEWLCFLGEMSNITNYDWYLKTHPDVLPGNNKIIKLLLDKYKNIKILPPEASHHQLIKEGIDFVLTVYGSIGHEYAYFGKKVINAGINNPHSGYDFNIHAKSIDEYKLLIMNLSKINLKISRDKIYEFYYMNYKYYGYNQLFFNSFQDFLDKFSVNDQNSSNSYEYFMNEITPKNESILCEKISTFIDSGNYKFYD